MKMKRFFAKDMRTALSEVKDVLGPDAVIMSNKKVSGGIEIVAAIDVEQKRKPAVAAAKPAATTQPDLNSFSERLQAYNAEQQAESHNSSPARTASHDTLSSLLNEKKHKIGQHTAQESSHFSRPMPQRHHSAHSSVDLASDPAMVAMQNEMQAIRQLLEHQVSGLMWQEMERSEPLRAMLVRRLQKLGLEENLADQFACYINEDLSLTQAWKHVQQLLAEQLVVTDDDVLRHGGVVALLGPTGVGKTTTIAKLAARYAQLHGADQVALITTDTYRIGALDQLAIYGKILGCPVKQARNANELGAILHQFRNKRLILIDTAGMGQRDVRLSEQLNTLTQNPHVKISNYLVLAANAQTPVLQDAVTRFRRVPLSGCIFTKLDECLSLGEAIGVAIQNALPIGYLTNGQRVPEDLRVANAEDLVRIAMELLARQESRSQSYDTGADAQLSSGHKDTKYNVGPGKWA